MRGDTTQTDGAHIVKKVGLTGSIATGKSTVLAMFAEAGIPTFSSDEAVHRLYADGAANGPIEALFPGVVHDGVVDRDELGRRLVAAPEKLAALEAIVHPLVRAEIAAFLVSAERAGAPLAVVDIPLLYEGGFDFGLDAVLVTAVDPDIQRTRVLGRPGMSVEKLEAILARQMPQAEKVRRADHVIDTSVPIETTRAVVLGLIASLRDGMTGQ